VSTHTYTVFLGDKPILMFGVAPMSILNGVGSPWLVGTDDMHGIRRQFVRECRPYVVQMLAIYGELRNFVDVRNEVSIRWLQWLGFKMEPAVRYGINGERFYPFVRRLAQCANP
jgi:hypothetical protein